MDTSGTSESKWMDIVRERKEKLIKEIIFYGVPEIPENVLASIHNNLWGVAHDAYERGLEDGKKAQP